MNNNLYKKMIHPIVWQNGERIMVDGVSSIGWTDATYEDVYRKAWEDFLEEFYPDASLEIEESYVPIELPQPEVIDVKPGQILCLHFDLNDWDLVSMVDYMKQFEDIIPNEAGIALVPNIDLKVMSQEQFLDLMERMKEKVKRGEENDI
jgi:hypothetical protein